MKRVLVGAAICSACTLGPRLVSAPMSSSALVARATPDAGASDDDAAATEGEQPMRLEGTWSGRAWQTGNTAWPLTVTFETNGNDVLARVHYPDQHCRAEWRLRRGAAQQWSGEERVLVDPFNRCPRNGHVTVTASDEGSLQWNWTGPGRSAAATLERSQP